MMLLPPINQRIKDIIDEQFNGSVRAFCFKLGLNNSQKINRLFNLDPRNSKYPVPSTEIVTLISNKLGVPIERILQGYELDEDNYSTNVSDIKESYVGSNNRDKEIESFKEPPPAIESKSDIRLLIEQNTQLIKNNTTLVETINKLSEELISMNRDAKNAHAREDAGCANVG